MTHANVGAWLGDLPGLNTMTRTRDMGTGEEHHGGWNSDGRVWIEADFRRGFVADVRLPLATFVGEACGRCDVSPGMRRYPTHGGDWIEDECNECCGTGQVGGCAAALAASQPVTRVTLTDREPDGSDNGNHPPFAYYLDALRLQYEPGAPIIPAELFDLLGGNLSPHRSWRDFPTRAAALDALSAACITYARRAAVAVGLVPDLWELPTARS